MMLIEYNRNVWWRKLSFGMDTPSNDANNRNVWWRKLSFGMDTPSNDANRI